MSKCHLCNVEILDETERCPLCQSVLEKTSEMESMYPDIRIKAKKWVLFAKIYFFLMIAIEIILFNVSFLANKSSIIFILPGLILLYGYVIIRYAIVGKSNYRAKVTVLTSIAVIVLMAIDFFAGYHGWSVNYVLPAGILFIDFVILLLMIINHRNWQSYMMLQLMMIVCSIITLILFLTGVITDPIVSIIAFNVSLLLFLGTLIIGDRRARTELKRRFHI